MTESAGDAAFYARAAKHRDIDLGALARVLVATLGRRLRATDVEVADLRLPKGAGTSSGTILFSASWSAGGTRQARDLVARTHPEKIQLYHEPDFHRQYAVLEALHRSGRVRVPEPLFYEEDASALGVPFFVMEQLHGRVPVTSPPYNSEGFLRDATPAQRRVAWQSAAEELCRIAAVPVSEMEFLRRREPGTSELERHLEYWRGAVDWSTGGNTPDEVWTLYEWLVKHLPAERPEGLAWGDARIGNMMFGDDFRLVGVMDWEAASLGGIRQDLGWWLFFDDFNGPARGLQTLDGLGTRDETLALWEQRVGEPAGDLTWFEAFTGFQIVILSLRMQLVLAGPGAFDLESNLGFRIVRERLGW